MSVQPVEPPGRTLKVASLFSGIGALDRGLELAGHSVVSMCESWEPARRVLSARFPEIPINGDIRTLADLPPVDLVAAGFPCTDISHAGSKVGIHGPMSGLVDHAFRLIEARPAEWVLLENVPNILTLHRGSGMRHIIARLEALGYNWAYRTVDSRFTGVPQRRPRVLVLASRTGDPRPLLLGEDAAEPLAAADDAFGFYWTEGRNGLGFVRGAVPTLKGGSTIGLQSAPAVWLPRNEVGRQFVLPTVEDGEALQGLPRGWTKGAMVDGERDHRWKLVGNAVTVGVAQWVGEGLARESTKGGTWDESSPIERGSRWPASGWGSGGYGFRSQVGEWPSLPTATPLTRLLDAAAPALSHRATKGFLSRLDESGREVNPEFYRALESHLAATRPKLRDEPARRRQLGGHKTPNGGAGSSASTTAMLRRALSERGLKYRLQTKPLAELRRRPDIVFATAKVAVDLRGCVWYGCAEHGNADADFMARWGDKVLRNKERGLDMEAVLKRHGWLLVVIWGHDDVDVAVRRIEEAVTAPREFAVGPHPLEPARALTSA